MSRDAIDFYHSLLTDELGAETGGQLDRELKERGLYFGDRPLCTVVRPRFFAPQQYRFCQERATVILGAFDKAHRAALADPAVRRQFRLFDWEEELVERDPQRERPSPMARLDAFLVSAEHGLRFTEYTAETPAGAGYTDALTSLFDALPVMRPFLRRYQLRPLPVRHHTLHALLTAYERWGGGRGEPPRVAIVDWREVPTQSEFAVFERFFHEHGIECVIADPREMEYTGGKLMAGDFHVTLIYKRVLISELVERCGLESPVVRAVTDGAVCMANSFACKILHKKASLAVLSDERNAGLYTAAEREAIDAHVPWTRVVEERTTARRGESIDLLPYVRENREQLVLKPNDEYGGKGIVLGWEVSDTAWGEAVAAAVSDPYIVQERITLPTSPYPSVVDGRVVIADRMLDTAPYVFDGQYVDGCLTRLGTTSLLNVTAGGGSNVPTYLVERR
jgi:hypothetical protein